MIGLIAQPRLDHNMLTLTIKDGQTITIGQDTLIHIKFDGNKQARLYIKAPKEKEIIHYRDKNKRQKP